MKKFLQKAGLIGILGFLSFTGWGQTFSPENGATGVSTSPTLTITFAPGSTVSLDRGKAIYIAKSDWSDYEDFSTGKSVPPIPQDSRLILDGNILTIDLSGFTLPFSQDYIVYVDPGAILVNGTSWNNLSDYENPGWNFRTEGTPPIWTTGYPLLSDQTESLVILNGQTDQDGTFYYVITNSELYPSAAQISAGTDENNSTVSVYGNGNGMMTASTPFSKNIDISDVEPGTYYIYSVTTNGSEYSEIKRNTLDRVPPIFSSFKPENGSTTVPTDTVISITFSDKLYATDGTEITGDNAADYVTLSQSGTPIACTGSVSNEGKTITLTPDAPLSENTSYSVSFSAFEDQYGNESEAIVPRTFTTDKANRWVGNGTITTWNDQDNWDDQNYVSGKSVVIDATATAFPEIQTGTVNVNNLTIEAGASLTQTGGTLNIKGLFTIESNAGVNGSFLPLAGSLIVDQANVRVKQSISTNNINYNIGIPVTGATKTNSGITGFLYRYDNSTNSYIALGDDDTLTPGIGYICRSNQSLVFTGDPVTSDVSMNLVRSDAGYGWNLVSNPFSASINFHDLDFEDGQMANSFWIWKNQDEIYGVYNAETNLGNNLPDNFPYIPSHQAFWVKVEKNYNNVAMTIPTSALVANTTSYLKSTSGTKYPSLKLAANFNGYTDEAAVAFTPEANVTGDDPSDSGKKLTTSDRYCQLYSLAGTEKMAINGLPVTTEETIVPIGFKAAKTGMVQLSIPLNTLPENSRVLLKDNSTGQYINLSETNTYEFNIENTGTNDNRFALYISGTKNVATDIEELNSDAKKTRFYSNNSEIIAYIGQLNNPKYRLFDINGKLLSSGRLNAESENRVKVSSKGTVILVVESDEKQLEFKAVF